MIRTAYFEAERSFVTLRVSAAGSDARWAPQVVLERKLG